MFTFGFKSPVILRDYMRILDGKMDKIRDLDEERKPEEITDVEWHYLIQEKDRFWTKELMKAYIQRWKDYSEKKAKKKDPEFAHELQEMRSTLKDLLYNKLENNMDIFELVSDFNLGSIIRTDEE